MANLKFQGWEWPHNPSNFTMSYENRVIKHEFPEIWPAETESFGLAPRTFSGSGAFIGPLAWSHFSALSKSLWDNSVGELEHPNYGKFTVRLTKCTSREEALPNYVEYDFEFVEHSNINIFTIVANPNMVTTPPPSPQRTYTVVRGDNLWNISKKYYGQGILWRRIADANKHLIKNPNLIYPGWVLVIP